VSIQRLKTQFVIGLATLGLASSILVLDAQRHVATYDDGEPIPPPGVPAPRLPDNPFEIDTAEGLRVRVSVVTRGLSDPWSLAFLPDGSMLVTERVGRLRLLRTGARNPETITGLPAIHGVQGGTGAKAGLMDVALHPRFAENHLVYLTYSKDPAPGVPRRNALLRGVSKEPRWLT